MVEELAVNSVEKKLDMQASILVGNYEYYYACGKLKSLIELAVDEETAPLVMKEIVDEALGLSKNASLALSPIGCVRCTDGRPLPPGQWSLGTFLLPQGAPLWHLLQSR